jgi:hypothetical protein
MSAAEVREADVRNEIETSLRKRNDELSAELCVLRGKCIAYFESIFGDPQEPEWMRNVRALQYKHRDADKRRALEDAGLAESRAAYRLRHAVGMPKSRAELEQEHDQALRHIYALKLSDPMHTELY